MTESIGAEEASTSTHQSQSHYRVFSLNRFRHAPVTKTWAAATFASSCVMMTVSEHKWHLIPALPAILKGKQLWKLLSSKGLFLDTQSIISGVLLIYYMRILERRMGSRKYANFLVLTGLAAILIELLLLISLRELGVTPHFLSTGPYVMLFSCLVQFALDVPSITFSTFLNFPVSQKIVVYMLSLQLFLGSPASMLSCFSGLVAGIIYRVAKFRMIDEVKMIPNFVCEILEWSLSPWIRVWEDKSGRILPMGATIEMQRQEILDQYEQRLIFEQMQLQNQDGPVRDLPFLRRLFGRYIGPEGGAERPSEANIILMQEMGFGERERIVSALQMSGNDVSSAANLLIQQSGGMPR